MSKRDYWENEARRLKNTELIEKANGMLQEVEEGNSEPYTFFCDILIREILDRLNNQLEEVEAAAHYLKINKIPYSHTPTREDHEPEPKIVLAPYPHYQMTGAHQLLTIDKLRALASPQLIYQIENYAAELYYGHVLNQLDAAKKYQQSIQAEINVLDCEIAEQKAKLEKIEKTLSPKKTCTVKLISNRNSHSVFTTNSKITHKMPKSKTQRSSSPDYASLKSTKEKLEGTLSNLSKKRESLNTQLKNIQTLITRLNGKIKELQQNSEDLFTWKPEIYKQRAAELIDLKARLERVTSETDLLTTIGTWRNKPLMKINTRRFTLFSDDTQGTTSTSTWLDDNIVNPVTQIYSPS